MDENQERHDDPTIDEQVQNRIEAGVDTPAHPTSGAGAESGAETVVSPLGEGAAVPEVVADPGVHPVPGDVLDESAVSASDAPEPSVDEPVTSEVPPPAGESASASEPAQSGVSESASASEPARSGVPESASASEPVPSAVPESAPASPAAESVEGGELSPRAPAPEAAVAQTATVSEDESLSRTSIGSSNSTVDDVVVPTESPVAPSADSPAVEGLSAPADAQSGVADVQTVEVPATPEAPDDASVAEPAHPLTPPAGAIDPEAEYSPFRDAAATAAVASAAGAETAPTAEFSQAQMLAAERAERKAARDKALGNVTRTPEPEPTPTPTVRTTDKFFPSLGLFLVRLVLAGIFGIRAVQHFTNLQMTNDLIAATAIPEPAIMAVVLCAGEMLIALGLLFGLLTRVAGFGVAAIAALALAFVYWGASNPFVAGHFGFSGEYELLLAAVGLLILFTGGGGWGFDRRFRRNRQRRKATGD